jgi:hypothetical protein
MVSAKRTIMILSILLLNIFILETRAQEFFPVLEISPMPEITGMGETGTGLADKISAVYLNPGGLAFQKDFKVNFAYCNWLSKVTRPGTTGIDYYNIAVIKNMENLGTFSGNVYYMDMGNTLLYPELKKAYEYYISAGYSRELMDDLGMGINIKYCQNNLSCDSLFNNLNSYGVAFDIGMLYKISRLIIPLINLDLSNRLSVGLNFANMGPNITYTYVGNEETGALPFTLRLGLGIKILDYDIHKLVWCVDLSRVMTKYDKNYNPDPFYKAFFTSWEDGGLNKVVSSTGMEYRFKDPDFRVFGNQLAFALRTGYLYEDENYGNRQYVTYGGTIEYYIFGFNFSYTSSRGTNDAPDKTWKWGFGLNL